MIEDVILSETESVCPECLQRTPAVRIQRGDRVFLRKECPRHGVFETAIWRGDPPWSSWKRPKTPSFPAAPGTAVRDGCPLDCGLCPEHRQHTCTALLEVTRRCNLRCAFCFADAGEAEGDDAWEDGGSGAGRSAGREVRGDETYTEGRLTAESSGNDNGVDARAGAGRVAPKDPDLEAVRSWFESVLRSGGTCNIQLSGGEPTLREDLPEIVRLGRSLGFPFIQVNTNGLRLAQQPGYARKLADAGVASVFLQFDGIDDSVYERLRGRPLFREKRLAVERCGECGIGVVLVPTLVPGVNIGEIGKIIDFAVERIPTVRGVHFQPVSYFGRRPGNQNAPRDEDRITIPEVMREIEIQTGGRVEMRNFKPPGCENAACSFHGNFILMPGGGLKTLTGCGGDSCCSGPETAAEGAARARRFVSRSWSSPAELSGLQVKGPSLGGWDLFLERAATHSFSISGMAFQDAWNLDLERLRECCIHVVAPDGRLVPFCAYNLTNARGRSLYREAGSVRSDSSALRGGSVKITPLENWIADKIGAPDGRLSRTDLEVYQLTRLRETVRLAKGRSSFYAERLKGFSEEDLHSLDDLSRFPFTTEEDIRRNPMSFLCVSQGEIDRVVTLSTSGTTGNPKRLFFTAEDRELTVDFFQRGMSVFTNSGDRVLILMPGERPGSVGDLLVKGLERLGATGIVHGPVTDVARTLDAMERERIDVLVGLPVQVLSLARASAGAIVKPPRSVLLSADHAPDAISRELQRLWDCQVFTHYGMTEMGFGGGVECLARLGYHTREADLYFEIVDPESGRPQPDGEWGEAVFTTLTRRGMPLIRYRTGDLGRFRPLPCRCGTVLKTMDRIRGRVNGRVKIGNGLHLTMADLDEALFPIAGLLDFTATITSESSKDRLHVRLEVLNDHGPEALPGAARALRTIPAVLSAELRGELLLSVDLRGESFQRVDSRTASSAFKRTIRDMRNHEKHERHERENNQGG